MKPTLLDIKYFLLNNDSFSNFSRIFFAKLIMFLFFFLASLLATTIKMNIININVPTINFMCTYHIIL